MSGMAVYFPVGSIHKRESPGYSFQSLPDKNTPTMPLDSVTSASVSLALGFVVSAGMLLAVRHTWRFWTQTKWYILMLALGNWIEVLFRLPTQLAVKLTATWAGGDVSCKVSSFMSVLGPNLAGMAVAALALHVLLTYITGCHGSRVRHALVIGLFVLLSFPWPLSKLPVYGVVHSNQVVGSDFQVCSDIGFFKHSESDAHLRFYFDVAGAIASIFFPLVIAVGAFAGWLMLKCASNRGSIKSDANTPDFVLALMLALVLVITCVPLQGFVFYFRGRLLFDAESETMQIYTGLVYLCACRVVASALVCVVFAYVHVYRTGRREEKRGKLGEGRSFIN